MQTKPNVNIYHAWTKADFDVARQCGSTPIAYCSGYDDPVACKALAAQWNVRLCLDVESSIRANGPWVQAWLDASGAGLYGNAPVFAGRHAPFFVMAAYPGYDPGKTWSGTVPSVPHGWQYQGTHSLFGIGVDTTNFDDWFATGGGNDMALGAGFFQGLAVFLSGGLLGRTREGDGSPGSNLDAAVASDLLNNPDNFIKQVHAVTDSQEFKNLQALLRWLEANATDGNGTVLPAKLAQALGTTSGGVTMDQVKAEISGSKVVPQ